MMSLIPIRLLVLLLLLGSVFLVAHQIWGAELEKQIGSTAGIGWLGAAGSWAWLAGIGLLVADLLLPIPGTMVMSALGYVYGPVVGGLVAAAGSMAAGVAGYGVGRCLGEKTARKWLGERDYEKSVALFERGGGCLIAASRALPILPEALACTAGLVRMPFRKFLMALACGSVPMGFLFAFIGAAGRNEPSWAIGFSLLIPAILWGIARKWRM